MASPRRISVKGHRGIYRRRVTVEYIDARGKRRTKTAWRYEVTYTDSAGKRRWETVPGYDNLDDAEAVREARRSRKRKGERVSPTKLTVSEWAKTWLEAQTQLRPRTRERYELALRVHILPRIGHLRLPELSVDDVTELIGEMRKAGLASWTIRGHLTPLSKMMGRAARKGMVAGNPVASLEKGERPPAEGKPKRILEPDELGRLLDAADGRYRLMLMTAALTGLRLGEVLGLTWADVDFDGGVVHVDKQLGRDGKLGKPKTPSSKRDVDLIPAFAGDGSSFSRLAAAFVGELRAHKLRSEFSRPTDLVFASATGTGLDHRNAARRGLEPAMRKLRIGDLRNVGADDLADQVESGDLKLDEAERLAHERGLAIEQKPPMTFHCLRHLYGSLQLDAGESLVDVAALMGHADSAITAKVYAHQVDAARRAERRRARVRAVDVTPMETSTVRHPSQPASSESASPAEVVSLSGFGDQRRAAATS